MIKLRRPTAAHSRSVDLGAESDEGIVNFLNSVSGLCRCAEDDDDMMVNMIIMMMMNGTNGQIVNYLILDDDEEKKEDGTILTRRSKNSYL